MTEILNGAMMVNITLDSITTVKYRGIDPAADLIQQLEQFSYMRIDANQIESIVVTEKKVTRFHRPSAAMREYDRRQAIETGIPPREVRDRR